MTQTLVTVRYGYSRSGAEMVHIQSTSNPLNVGNIYIRLNAKRQIISLEQFYDGFTPVSHSFNLSGLFAGEVVESAVLHLQRYSCLINASHHEPVGRALAARQMQMELIAGANPYLTPLYDFLPLTDNIYALLISDRLVRMERENSALTARLRETKDRNRLLECMVMDSHFQYRNRTAIGRIREYARKNISLVKAITFFDDNRSKKLLKCS